MLTIRNLSATIENKTILDDLNLTIGKGEVHAIMGPNGSGKSTLSHVLAGRECYTITNGSIAFEGKDLLSKKVEERAHMGMFLAFQYPVEIPGVISMNFLRTSVNSMRKARGEEPLDAATLLKRVRSLAKMLGISEALLKRAVNSGFSGGEKKRFEMLQMMLLEPKLTILDETDSGLDVDALRNIATTINTLRSPERSFIIITHYQRLLDYIEPDHIHILAGGKIVRSGGKELALILEKEGYKGLGVNTDAKES